MTPAVGFIGFGEAGFTIGDSLRLAGVGPISAFDIAMASADRGPLIRDRAARSQTTLAGTPGDLAASSDVLFSTVTSSSALDAARQMLPFLAPRHIYADLNSVSPAAKREIADLIGGTGAVFVEVAVMAPVQPYGHRVPMLLGGPGAQAFAERFRPYGMRLEVLPATQVGAAAAVKMCRSVVVKGLEALLTECVLGASHYGATDLVFASLQESYPGIDWKTLAAYNMGRLVVHGERRAREMEEVAETLRAIGIDPIMADATARRQDWSARLNLRSHFGPEGPKCCDEVVAVVTSLTAAGKQDQS